MRLLSYDQLKPEKGVIYSREQIRRLVKAKDFPEPVPVSDQRIAWVESEIDEWVAARVAKRGQKQAA